jgi:hypothetical protein
MIDASLKLRFAGGEIIVTVMKGTPTKSWRQRITPSWLLAKLSGNLVEPGAIEPPTS